MTLLFTFFSYLPYVSHGVCDNGNLWSVSTTDATFTGQAGRLVSPDGASNKCAVFRNCQFVDIDNLKGNGAAIYISGGGCSMEAYDCAWSKVVTGGTTQEPVGACVYSGDSGLYWARRWFWRCLVCQE
jgi:hypothetical protein